MLAEHLAFQVNLAQIELGDQIVKRLGARIKVEEIPVASARAILRAHAKWQGAVNE